MAWQLSDRKESQRLERAFSKRGIPFDQPGFSDHPLYLAEERQNPRFLEMYARYVEARSYDEAYLSAARTRIIVSASALAAAIEADGRLGACVDASGMLGRILDRLAVWNYVAKATLTIALPPRSGIEDRHFWAIDEGNFVAAHAIVIAPPFGVVDVTVHHQPYEGDEAEYLPALVMADRWQLTSWAPEDLANVEIRAALEAQGLSFGAFLREHHGPMCEVMTNLPPRLVQVGETTLKYVIVAVGGMIEQLDGIINYKPGGRTALEILEQDIQPQIA